MTTRWWPRVAGRSRLAGLLLLVWAALLASATLWLCWERCTDRSRSTRGRFSCRPLDHIFFLKTHKCGSSTLQNVIFRRGLERDLNFVLPNDGNYLGHPARFDAARHIGGNQTLPAGRDPSRVHYDVFAVHARLQPGNVRAVMPPDVRFVTMLRRPAELFQSLFVYNSLDRIYKKSLQQLLTLPLEEIITNANSSKRFYYRIGYNQMAFDLGLDPQDFFNIKKIQNFISMLDGEFSLVLLCDRMAASLVLLAELMCWPLEDVRFLSMNARPQETRLERLSPELEAKLDQLNAADTALYMHFKLRFDAKIKAYGESRMSRDVARLERLNEELRESCVEAEVATGGGEDGKLFAFMTYKLKEDAPPICYLVTKNEYYFLELLRTRQSAKIRELNDVLERK